MSTQKFWFTPEIAQKVLDASAASREVEVSLDLGLSTVRVPMEQAGARLPDGSVISHEQLASIADMRRGCIVFENGHIEPIELAADYFYKLIPTNEAPTLEISGIQMHRTVGTAPFENAMRSARSVVRAGARVLDTCGGLGYTAISAARIGASEVISLDIDPNVRAIARLNPWSEEYFSGRRIKLVDIDAAEYVAAQPDRSFDCVIHDPPRFSRAGHLYGLDFYKQAARILKSRGKMFHYTGEPFAKTRGGSFVQGVIRRLNEAGFSVEKKPNLQGVIATLSQSQDIQ